MKDVDVRCILTGHFVPGTLDLELVTLCGRHLFGKTVRDPDTGELCPQASMEWVFLNPTHAVATGIAGSATIACIECVRVAVNALEGLT